MLLLAVFVYDPLTWIVSLFLAADLARTAVVLFITLARQSGSRCQINLKTLTVLLALNDSSKQFFLAITSVTSALGVFERVALYKLRFTLPWNLLNSCISLLTETNKTWILITESNGHLQTHWPICSWPSVNTSIFLSAYGLMTSGLRNRMENPFRCVHF